MWRMVFACEHYFLFKVKINKCDNNASSAAFFQVVYGYHDERIRFWFIYFG